jgi:hypothetical protein
VHQRDHPERYAEHFRAEDVADDLGRPRQPGLSGVDPVKRLRGVGVEPAQRRPASADEQQEQREALVGGGQMARNSPPPIPFDMPAVVPARRLSTRR